MTSPKEAGTAAVIGSGDRSPKGTVRIAPAVLIDLADLAVQDMPGSAGLRSRRHALPTRNTGGARTYDHGRIAGIIGADQTDAVIAVAIERGTDVGEFSADAQQRVGFAVGPLPGMAVVPLDVSIEDVVPGSTFH